MKFSKSTAALICVGFVSLSAVAFAHNGATGIVKERMDGMSAMGKALKSMSEMVKGKRAYDADAMRRLAVQIKSHSGDQMLRLFPEGEVQPASEATPKIWTDWERFSELAINLETVAQSLVDTAEDGIDETAFKSIAGACAACHNDFRQKK